MSINGLQNQYFANSLDGLTYLDVNGISINGDNIDLTALVPYVNADKPVDVGVQPIRTSYIPIVNNDVVNLLALNQTTTGTVGYVDQYYVPYNGAISDTNLGNKAFTVGIAGNTNLSGLVKTELNRVLAGYTPATIVVGNNFGTITNAGGVYQSTSTATFASLFLGSVVVGEKYSISLSLKCIDPNYNTNIYVYEASVPNFTLGGLSLLSFNIPINTTGFTVFTGTFTPTTYTNLILVFNTQIVTGINTLYWNAFSLTGMGSVVKNLIAPTTSLDATNKTYVDTADALRVPYTGATGNVDLSTYTISSSTVPASGNILTNKTYVDAQDALRASLTGNNTLSGTNSFTNTVSMTPATATATFSLGLNGSNQIVKFTPSSGIGGSVSTGYVPYASAANTLANSAIFQSGTSIGIGTITPSQKLHILGDGARIQVESNHTTNAVIQIKTNTDTSYLFTDQSGNLQIYPGNIAKYLLFQGVANINGGTGYAVQNAYMQSGSLTIGDTTKNYGGGSTWNSNTAGLMFECLDNTEIAVHDAGNRVASFMYFTSANNTFTLGRSMGWGTSNISITGSLGVGLASPTYKLDVAGSMRVSSGDSSRCVYGPNSTWGAHLIVGSGTEVSGPAIAGVISTNGNLHLDGGNSNGIYYGYYANSHGTPNPHYFWGGDYQYNAMPQNYSEYSQVCVMVGDRIVRSQAVAHQVVVYPSNSWGPGTNLVNAFYRYNGWTSQMIIGRLSYYVGGNVMAYPTIRIYSQSTGQYWYFQTNNFTNNGGNHITVPIYAIFSGGYTNTTGRTCL